VRDDAVAKNDEDAVLDVIAGVAQIRRLAAGRDDALVADAAAR
jgi:hypothetical protein